MRIGSIQRLSLTRFLLLFPELYVITQPQYLIQKYIVGSDPNLDNQKLASVQQYLIRSNIFWSVFWKQGYFFVNMILYLDLYLIMKQPFRPQALRIRHYFVALILYLSCWTLAHFYFPIVTSRLFGIYQTVSIMIFLIASFTFLLLILKFLTKKGTNKTLRM